MGIAPRSSLENRPGRRKKPDELLSSVVRETATPAAVEMLRRNSAFILPSGSAWVALLLRASDIGGLSRRTGRDEAKGSLIELIESDQIEAVTTAEMLEAEVLGIIPTPATLDRMSEFSLLMNAPYSLAVFWQDENDDLRVEIAAEADLSAVSQVAGGTLTLRELVGPQLWAENGGGRRFITGTDQPDDDPEATMEMAIAFDDGNAGNAGIAGSDSYDSDDNGHDDEPAPSFGEDEAPGFEDDSAFEDDSSFDEAPAFGEDEDEDVDDEAAGYGVEDTDEDPQSDDGSDGEPSHGDDRVVTAAEVSSGIARRFLSGGNDLTIDLDEFHTMFSTGAPVAQIEAPAGTQGWLGDQLAQMTRQANAGLVQLRQRHEMELQTLYVSLMSQNIDEVSREISNRFDPMEKSVKADHEERRAEIGPRVDALREELNASFAERMKAESERAAAEAASRFRANNSRRLDRDLVEAATSVERSVEAEYEHERQQLAQARRTAVQQHLELGQTRLVEVVREQQSVYLAAERTLMEEWNTQILNVLDDYRKDDIARVKVLGEQQSRDDTVAALRSEQAQALASLQAQHAERIAQLEDSLARSRQEAVDRMASRDAEWGYSLERQRDRADEEAASAGNLREQLARSEAAFQQRYDARVAELEADRQAAVEEMDRTSMIHGRVIRLLVVLVSVLMLAMIGITALFIRSQL